MLKTVRFDNFMAVFRARSRVFFPRVSSTCYTFGHDKHFLCCNEAHSLCLGSCDHTMMMLNEIKTQNSMN